DQTGRLRRGDNDATDVQVPPRERLALTCIPTSGETVRVPIMAIQPFQISVPQSVLDDLEERLGRTRWTSGLDDAGWDYGTDPHYLRPLCDYWRDGFDWPKQQAYLNSFRHFRADLDGTGLHFIHEQGTSATPLPILLVHGWPDSFVRFLKLLPLLAH